VRLQASAPGYGDGVATGRIPDAGGAIRLRIELAAEGGTLAVQSEPPQAYVYVDGRAAGMSPLVVDRLSPGTHEVSVRRAGWTTVTETVTIKAGDTTDLSVMLVALDNPATPENVGEAAEDDGEKPPPGFGRLILVANVESRFYVDNQVAGYGARVVRNIGVGERLVFAQAERRGSDSRRLDVEEGKTSVVRFEFPEDPLENARRAYDKKDPYYWVAQGGSTRNSGRYGDAVDQFKRALELDPNYYPAHRQLGLTLPAMKRYEEALEHLERYVELNPHAPDRDFAFEIMRELQQKIASEEDR